MTSAVEMCGYYTYDKGRSVNLSRETHDARVTDADLSHGGRKTTGAAKIRVRVYVVLDISEPKVMYTGTDSTEAMLVAVEHLNTDGYDTVEVVPSGEGEHPDCVLSYRDGLGNWSDTSIWILDTEVTL